MVRRDCFAYRTDDKCSALKKLDCDKCGFYKPAGTECDSCPNKIKERRNCDVCRCRVCRNK